MNTKNRRDFLKKGTFLASGVAALQIGGKALASSICSMTPAQTEGPFYPGESKFTSENDLTRVSSGLKPIGQVIYIFGIVQDENCKPIEGANVEIWQACYSGKYNNPSDPNPAPLDPNFRYWGETYTNQKGEYSFKTIIPGAYKASNTWTRPPHIHFKIAKLGFIELTTQMYFKGEEFNNADLILKQIPSHEQNSVIVDFLPSSSDLEPGSLTGEFDINLKSVKPS